ncbi:hypothetical protein W02_17720 [Nitrospira sp. KM1]|nr:hypothetical protein W02_17720 [Nitrospira sp. KM1]
MLRLIEGGNHSSGPYIDNPYRGTRFPYISANVVDRVSGEPILPPFVVKEVGAIKLAFIGAVLKETPTVVMPAGISHLRFLDEIESINRYVRYLRESRDIRTFVVLIHQGGRQTAYEGPTQPGVILTGQEIMKIIEGLDDDVDVVVSGHSHNFTNTLVKNSHGKDILVIQAFASGTAYADIQLQIDRSTGDVVEKVGAIVTAYADRGPGLVPDPEVKQLVSLAEQKVAPLTMRFIGEAQTEILRIENEAGESDLGNLVADAQRAAMKTDFAFMNPGGLRADLPKGAISFRDLFLVQPFSNTLLRMTLSGQDIYDLLNQQWVGQSRPRMLKVSGLTYSWDNRRLPGEKVVDVRGQDGLPLDRAKTYSITVNDYLAAGGDRFSVFIKGRDRVGGPVDIEALVSYVKLLPQPFECPSNNRILRLR